MSLNRIWEQPTPARKSVPIPFEYVNPAPAVAPPRHAHLIDYAPAQRVYYADGTFPLQTLADVHPAMPDGHLYDLHNRYIPQTWPNYDYGAAYEAIRIRAAHLSHRTIQDEMAVHGPYALPRLCTAPIAVASPKRTLSLNEALATWYAEQVTLALVIPGQFRPGVSGASHDKWGATGREIDAWDRVGMPIPSYSHHYAKTSSAPANRDASLEVSDPYNIMWKNLPRVHEPLVSFIVNLLQRMTIAPTAVVSAVWYLQGLGLHEGDGEKGKTLRRLLHKEVDSEDDGVEKRVALLGLLLSGKWLDDNAFLTSSWSEVSYIAKKDIEKLEFAALSDLHHSLHIPMSSWTDFVNMRWTELLPSADRADAHGMMCPLLDKMVSDARTNELWEPVKPKSAAAKDVVAVEYYDYVDRRLEELYYADHAEQEGPEEAYAPRESRGSTPVSQWSFPPVDEEMEDAARNVSALVDDEMDKEYEEYEQYEEDVAQVEEQVQPQPVAAGDLADSEDESEDEFLDYDGAARFLPTISELRRSASNSSAQSDAIAEWRAGIVSTSPARVNPPPTPAFARSLPQVAASVRPVVSVPATLPPTFAPNVLNFDIPSPYDRPAAVPPIPTRSYDTQWRCQARDSGRDHTRITSSEARGEPFDHDAYESLGRRGTVRTRTNVGAMPIPAVARTKLSSMPSIATQPTLPKFNPTGVYLEPGIAQVRPSRYCRQPLDALHGMENMDPHEAAIMAVLNPTGFTVPSRWD